MRRFAVALLLALCAAPARADGADDADKAEELFAASARHYRAGRYERAIELLREAYRLSRDPVLLFNLAKSYEGKGDRPRAVKYYAAYLKKANDVPDRGAIERRIATLREQIAEEERLRRAAADESPSPVPWIVAGSGLAGVAVGVALGVLAKNKEADADAEPVQLNAAELLAEGERLAIGANVALVLGAALVAGGATWGVIDVVLHGGEDEPVVRLRIGPLGAAAVLVLP